MRDTALRNVNITSGTVHEDFAMLRREMPPRLDGAVATELGVHVIMAKANRNNADIQRRLAGQLSKEDVEAVGRVQLETKRLLREAMEISNNVPGSVGHDEADHLLHSCLVLRGCSAEQLHVLSDIHLPDTPPPSSSKSWRNLEESNARERWLESKAQGFGLKRLVTWLSSTDGARKRRMVAAWKEQVAVIKFETRQSRAKLGTQQMAMRMVKTCMQQ